MNVICAVRFFALMALIVMTSLHMELVLGQAIPAAGQSYPTKLVRIITPLAGGNSDIVARLVARGLTGSLGQPVIVDNRPTLLTGDVVAQAAPDGYSLLVAGSYLWTVPLSQRTSYDAFKDFSPITLMASQPNIVVVHSSLPVKSVKELIALAKARPGELNYGSGTIGGTSYLAAELFKSMAGIDILGIHYRAGGPAMNALLSGEVQTMFAIAGVVMPYVKSGRLRMLAITSAEPSALAPGVPTVAAAGLPGYESASINAMFAPAKTPNTVIERLNQEVVRLIRTSDVKEKLVNAGMDARGGAPQELVAAMRSEVALLTKLMKNTGVQSF